METHIRSHFRFLPYIYLALQCQDQSKPSRFFHLSATFLFVGLSFGLSGYTKFDNLTWDFLCRS